MTIANDWLLTNNKNIYPAIYPVKNWSFSYPDIILKFWPFVNKQQNAFGHTRII